MQVQSEVIYYLTRNAYYLAYISTSDRGKTNIVRVGYLTAVQLLMVGGLVGDLLAFHAQTTLTSNISAINPFKKEAHATHMHALCM